MTNEVRPPQPGKRRLLRMILLLSALVTSPLLCYGAILMADLLPSSLLPSGLDFFVNLFEARAEVQNRTGETLYVTAITTTYGRPMVISQNIAFRQRDIPLQPNTSVVLTYDSADLPLSGIAVCRVGDDCRLLVVNGTGRYSVDSVETLSRLDPGWLAAIRSHPLYNDRAVQALALSLLPILLLFASWYVGRLERQIAG
ncbi:hypothetical protein FKZ61_002645 [Litorilinea aerophila]|uniref:Uncharacterized protein n=1 Tax=Litorilinea aerophila TaxID=1204385 RepID=A0A540VKQ0_9CHLR|nr:hypothetical protein [Litorilinea aerophila]MCC9075012.1 hypothetical protein [Litorilinea aerophila]